ncbi:MAG: hypothetical protein JXA30_02410 [Deltaproteobacteria bacterium]|nr:hypothetical protein [Deltaproteobacteria bacterium]
MKKPNEMGTGVMQTPKAGSSALAALLILASCLAPGASRADVTFILESDDSLGVGFNDTTPASPVGGNNGVTLGQQRRIAFEYALSLYQKVIYSDVPIVVKANFTDLHCDDITGAVLGASAPVVAISSLSTGRADPNLVYPIALANHIHGSDLDPEQADIAIELNNRIDQPDCLGEIGWYYGLDGEGNRETLETDFVRVVLHEMGHGLGFIDFVNRDSGETVFNKPDVFSVHVLDNKTGELWSEMTNSERLDSFTHVRNVVWQGRYVSAFAPDYLVLGSPIIRIEPELSGFSAIVSEAGFGPPVSEETVKADLAIGSPTDGCSRLNDLSGDIALLYAGDCAYESMAYNAQRAGAVAVLIAARDLTDSPPPHLDYISYIQNINIPTLSVTLDDAEILLHELENDRQITVELSGDPNVRVGADQHGRVYLMASDPLTDNSISHWDFLARNDLLMEPRETIRDDIHDIDLTPAFLRDIGWNTVCGNGRIDDGEECDTGDRNSDSEPNACRTTCRPASCGDGVVDDGEQCDSGSDNRDDLPDHCRGDCSNPYCGDGVVDSNEQCDSGEMNSDTTADSCRTDCTDARCGDGVVDSNEQCDPEQDGAPVGCDADCRWSLEKNPVQEQPVRKHLGPARPTQQQPVGNALSEQPLVPAQPIANSENEPAELSNDDGCGCRTYGLKRARIGWLTAALFSFFILLRSRRRR